MNNIFVVILLISVLTGFLSYRSQLALGISDYSIKTERRFQRSIFEKNIINAMENTQICDTVLYRSKKQSNETSEFFSVELFDLEQRLLNFKKPLAENTILEGSRYEIYRMGLSDSDCRQNTGRDCSGRPYIQLRDHTSQQVFAPRIGRRVNVRFYGERRKARCFEQSSGELESARAFAKMNTPCDYPKNLLVVSRYGCVVEAEVPQAPSYKMLIMGTKSEFFPTENLPEVRDLLENTHFGFTENYIPHKDLTFDYLEMACIDGTWKLGKAVFSDPSCGEVKSFKVMDLTEPSGLVIKDIPEM